MKCIKYPNGLHIRISERLANMEVEAGKATFTTKSALYHFWKTQGRLQANDKALKSFDFSNKQEENFLHKEENGNTYAYLKRGNKESIKPVAPATEVIDRKPKWWEKVLQKVSLGVFKPKVTEIVKHDIRLKVINYPVYQRFLVGVTN